jgi:hypothetical protein
MARMRVACIIFIAVLVSMIGSVSAMPPARPDDILESRTLVIA